MAVVDEHPMPEGLDLVEFYRGLGSVGEIERMLHPETRPRIEITCGYCGRAFELAIEAQERRHEHELEKLADSFDRFGRIASEVMAEIALSARRASRALHGLAECFHRRGC